MYYFSAQKEQIFSKFVVPAKIYICGSLAKFQLLPLPRSAYNNPLVHNNIINSLQLLQFWRMDGWESSAEVQNCRDCLFLTIMFPVALFNNYRSTIRNKNCVRNIETTETCLTHEQIWSNIWKTVFLKIEEKYETK